MTILLSRDTLAACHRLALDHYGPDDEVTEQLLDALELLDLDDDHDLHHRGHSLSYELELVSTSVSPLD